jgi:hypothetical protein
MLQIRNRAIDNAQTIRWTKFLSTSVHSLNAMPQPDFHIHTPVSQISYKSLDRGNEISLKPRHVQKNGTQIYAMFREMISKNNKSHSTAEKARQQTAYDRQIRIENEQFLKASAEREKLIDSLQGIGQGTSMHSVQRSLVRWYEPVVKSLRDEVKKIEKRETGVDRSVSYFNAIAMLC